MSVIGNPLLLGGDAGAPSYTIDRSVRLRSSASAYFNRTPASVPTSYRKTTISFWAKNIHKSDGDYTTIYSTGDYNLGTPASRYGSGIYFVGGKLYITEYAAGTTRLLRESNALFRDPSAWYHFVIAIDSTLPQGNGQCIVWCNNELLSWTTATNPTQNTDLQFQSNIVSYIGTTSFTNPASKGRFLDGYLTEVNFIDGQALTPSAFGEYDAVRNTQWKPKAYSGSWGTNGFYLKFANPASIGLDSSGNGNNWTANNIQTSNSALTTYDSMLDVPTLTSATASNFCTLNPLAVTPVAATFAEGNLKVTTGLAGGNAFGTLAIPSSGKWYWEITAGSGTSPYIGVSSYLATQTYAWQNTNSVFYSGSNGQKQVDGTASSYGSTYTTNDVIGVAVDVDASTITFYKNNVSQGAISHTFVDIFPSLTDGASATSDIFYANFGQRPFTYTPPTGFKALNTFNLPDGAVPSSDDYHKVYTYTGNGGGLQVGEIQKPMSLYNLDRSLRFKGTNSYFDKVFASGGANTKGTISMWVKRGKLGVQQELFRFGTTGTLFSGLLFSSTDTMSFVRLNSTYQVNIATTRVFKDPSLWYHIVVAWDTTLATASDRVKIYVNGIQETVFASATYPTQNLDMYFFTAGTHNIGRYPVGGNYFGGYMAEFHAVDGTQLTANDFGQFDGNYYWTPKDYTGGYGTNGWHLDFEDYSSMSATGIGKDVSGLGNNFTPYNFDVTVPANTNVAWDSMVDVPTPTSTDVANFCTLSPLTASVPSLIKDGNLQISGTTTATAMAVVGTLAVSSGKWYWECTPNGTNSTGLIGIITSSVVLTTNVSATWLTGQNYYWYFQNGNKSVNGTGSAYGATFTTNDVIGIALDLDAGTITFYKNGVSQGVAATGISGSFTPFTYDASAGSCSINWAFNFGQRPLRYPLAGHKTLNALNVAEVTGDLESPDFVWIKSRSALTDHALFNSVVGAGKYVRSSNTALEVTDVNSLLQFNKNGFLLGNAAIVNTSAATYVAAAWKAAATNQTIAVGEYATTPANVPSIASTVRANPTAGISVVTWVGNGSASATVGHGLGATPSMIICKDRSVTAGWSIYHKNLAANTGLAFANNLAFTAASTTSGIISTSPTDLTFGFTAGSSNVNNVNASGSNIEAFCFAEVAGFSKFGSYVGNGLTDGPFVFLGFRPRFVMIKKYTGGATVDNWEMFDTERNTSNVNSFGLYPNTTGTDLGSRFGDVLSNGFKLRYGNGTTNESLYSYIYMAFAEHPFKYSLAR